VCTPELSSITCRTALSAEYRLRTTQQGGDLLDQTISERRGRRSAVPEVAPGARHSSLHHDPPAGHVPGAGVLQDAFNTGSLSLYASLGFDVAEPVALMSGRPRSSRVGGVEVRPLELADIGECQQLHRSVHGFARTAELEDALAAPHFSPMVATREGRVVAYAATLTFFAAAHAVAKTQVDMAGLIAGALATTEEPASFLLPTRQTELFRWCLGEGLRIVKPMTYMTVGRYETPAGSWIPSVLY
jgi:hypothetical protein